MTTRTKNMLKPFILLLFILGLTIILPAPASTMTVKAIYLGSSTSYAVDDNGDLWAWGDYNGQNYVHPAKVTFIDHITMVASGSCATIALKEDGSVWAWGSAPPGQPAAFPGENSSIPVQVNISAVKFIAFCPNTVYMVKNDGSLWMCGDGLILGSDSMIQGKHIMDPVRLPINNVSRLEAASTFIFAQKDDGSWWGWGDNTEYQLNDGTNIDKYSPVNAQIDNVNTMSIQGGGWIVNDEFVSQGVVIALKSDGQVYAWGNNQWWVSGDPNIPMYTDASTGKGYVIVTPHPVPGMKDVIAIGSGSTYYVAVKKDGTVWTWGSNPYSYNQGESPASLDSRSPIRVPGLSDITAIIVGDQHCMAVKSDGTVWAWGRDQNGELGDGQIISNAGGNSGMPKGVRVTDLSVDMPYGISAVPTPTPTPVSSASPSVSPNASGTPADVTITPSPTAQLPEGTPIPSQADGFDFAAILATIGLALVGDLTYSRMKR